MSIESLLFTPRRQVSSSALILVQGASVEDLSANRLIPTASGAAPTPTMAQGPFPGVGSLDCTNGRLSYPMDKLMLQDFLIEGWVRFKSGYNATATHILGSGNGIAMGTWALCISDTKPTFLIGAPGGEVNLRFILTATAAPAIAIDTWYLMSVSRKGNTFYIFLNGNLVGTATSSYSAFSSTPFTIGDRQAGDAFLQYPLRGFVGGCRIQAGIEVPTQSYAPPTGPWLN